MIQRRKPLARGKPLRRSTKPIPRGKAPRKRSAKMKLRQKAWRSWVEDYFRRFGNELGAPCQSCGRRMLLSEGPHPHHKLRRGAGGKDEPENLVVLCATCHLVFIHDGQIGAATAEARKRQAVVMISPANVLTGRYITWPPDMADDLRRILSFVRI